MMHTLAPWLSALVAASLKGSIILVAALLAVRGMRRSSAEARHAILAIGLVAFLVVPLATLLAPAWAVVRLPVLPLNVAMAIDRAADDDRVIGGSPTRFTGDAARVNAVGAGSRAPTSADRSAGTGRASSSTSRDAGGKEGESRSVGTAPTTGDAARVTAMRLPTRGEALMLAWLIGASLIAVRLLFGLARLRFLSSRATMVTDGAWLQTAHAIARRLGLTRGVTLLRGDREAVPMTWGVLSPVVWLPPAADAWPAELRSSVLSHELAHVRRRDAVMQWIANIAVAAHWFNPLVWMATRALRAERERACDDAVLALGAAPDDYAAHLLDMVRALGASGGPAPAMAMARRSQFEGRLLAILDRACSRAPVGAGRLLVSGIGAAVFVLVLGGLRSGEAARAPESLRELAVLPGATVSAVEQWQSILEKGVGTATRSQVQRTPASLVQRSAPMNPIAPAGPVSATVRSSEPSAHSQIGGSTAALSALPQDSGAVSQSPPTTSASLTPPPVHQPTPTPVVSPSALQSASLSRTDTALLLDVIAAAEGISSSSDRVAVLERVASLPDLAPTVVTALGRAASRVTSGTSRTKLLRTLVRKQAHAVGESRRAVLDALSQDMTSTDFSAVLEDFIKRDSISEPALADAFTTAAKMSSSTEKSRVLIVAARLRKPEGAARAAYLKAAATITNGSDRARTLSALFEEPPERQGGAPQQHQH